MAKSTVISGLDHLVPIKGTLNATAYNNSMLPSLCQQYGEDPFLFQHGNAPVHKARSIKKWFSQLGVEELEKSRPQPDRTSVGINVNAGCEPELVAKHQCRTSLILRHP